MARVRSANFDEKRQQIRDTCARLFAEKGYPKTSIEDIAQACGMVKSVLYHYHKSKERILFDIIIGHIEEVHGAVEEALSSNQSPDARFERLIVALIEVYVGARHQQTVLNNDRYFLSRISKKKAEQAEKTLINATANAIAEVNPFFLEEGDARNVATMLVFGMVNWTYTWYRAGGPINPRQLAALISQICLSGLHSVDARVLQTGKLPDSRVVPSGRGSPARTATPLAKT